MKLTNCRVESRIHAFRNDLQVFPGRPRRSTRQCRSMCVPGDKDGREQNGEAPLEGQSNVQDALVDVIRLNIGKKKALDQLGEAVDDEKLKLIKKTDQVQAVCDS